MSVLPASKATVERVKALLRRDLKLGPDAIIPDDMPLMGGRLDLDSLDVLMVITTIEKEFGIKAPADGSAKAIFQSVATLSEYLETHTASSAAPTKAAPKLPTKEEALARLPHRAPFRFVSRLDELHPGESGRATWILSGEETFFAGHFPGRPIVPGVLLGEALAQLSGIVASAASSQMLGEGRLAQVNIRFHQAVSPPVEITLASSVTKMLGTLAEFQVRATHGGQTLADGSLTLSLVPSPSLAEAGH